MNIIYLRSIQHNNILLLFLFLLLVFVTPGVNCSTASADGGGNNGGNSNPEECICKDMLPVKPNIWNKEETARWMVHVLNYGILSSISSRYVMNSKDKDFIPTKNDDIDSMSSKTLLPIPFGNVYSFVDGTCNNSTGIPYIYGTYYDQSFIDIIKNNAVSLTLTENSLSSSCSLPSSKSCTITPTSYGDPESPVCARLVLSGTLDVLTSSNNIDNDLNDDDEYNFALNALYERHPSMKDWPTDHNWIVGKINIKDIWLIDYFGGATIINIDKYKSIQFNLNNNEEE